MRPLLLLSLVALAGCSAESLVPIRPLEADARWLIDDDTWAADEAWGELMLARAACDLYRTDRGDRVPDFVHRGWDELVSERYLPAPPVNPLSPDEVASEVIVVERAGADGTDFDPTIAGWVYNRADRGGRLYAAGMED